MGFRMTVLDDVIYIIMKHLLCQWGQNNIFFQSCYQLVDSMTKEIAEEMTEEMIFLGKYHFSY